MNKKYKIMALAIFLVTIIGFGIAQVALSVDFDTPRADRLVNRCGGNLTCYSEVYDEDSYPRYFTIIHEDGTVEKAILLEDLPVNITDLDSDERIRE